MSFPALNSFASHEGAGTNPGDRSSAAAKAAGQTPGWQQPATGSQQQGAATLLLCFRIAKPGNLKWTEVLTSIKGQGYTRVLVGQFGLAMAT